LDDDRSKLAARIERLEKEARWIRGVGACVLILSGAFFLMGQAAPTNGVVEAKDFILRDADGKLRARLSMDEQLGGPMLRFYDEHLPPRLRSLRPIPGQSLDKDRLAIPTARFGLVGNRPLLALSDLEGQQSASLSIHDTGPLLVLNDENGKGGLELTFIKGRGPALTIMDADQNIRARIEVDKTEPYLKVTGYRGRMLFAAQDDAATTGDPSRN
jgi:hypothetical protein